MSPSLKGELGGATVFPTLNIPKYSAPPLAFKILYLGLLMEDGGEVGGSRVHFPSAPVKCLADLRNRANSQRYSSIYESRRPKIEDIERSEGKKGA